MQETTEFVPVETLSLLGGVAKRYRFDNGFGASVVCHRDSHGGIEGLWELAVLKWDGDTFELTYDTDMTDDVIGRLSENEVNVLLQQIKDLPKGHRRERPPADPLTVI